jgi:hypothetical protein
MVQITFHHMPLGAIEAQGLAGWRFNFNKTCVVKTGLFQTQRLAASACANFNGTECHLGCLVRFWVLFKYTVFVKMPEVDVPDFSGVWVNLMLSLRSFDNPFGGGCVRSLQLKECAA